MVNNQTYRFHQNRYQSTDFGRLNSYVICLLIGFAVASPHTPSNTSAVQSDIAVPVAQNSGSTTPTSGSTTPKQIETTELMPF